MMFECFKLYFLSELTDHFRFPPATLNYGASLASSSLPERGICNPQDKCKTVLKTLISTMQK